MKRAACTTGGESVPMPENRDFAQILVEMGAATEEEVARATVLGRQKKLRIDQAVLELGFATEEAVARALCRIHGLPFVDLGRGKLSQALIRSLPADVVKENRIVPVKASAGSVVVALDDPERAYELDGIGFRLSLSLRPALTTPTGLREALATYWGAEQATPAAVATETKETTEGELSADDAPVIRLVDSLLKDAVNQRASDIHVEPLSDRIRVRYRIDGRCQEVRSLPKSLQGPILSRLKIVSHMDMAEKRRPQDGRISMQVSGREIDYRVSALPAYHGESLVLRVLDKERGLVTLAELGFDASDYERFERMIRRPNGIFLVTGPTGSGKTTTLYAALRQLNRPDVKILTAENPVEYNLTGINQCNVRSEIGLSFARILRSMLRQAPDIILVGEIRDVETAEIAIQASLTGHLVFSTLHTNDAPSALTRLVDMGVKRFLVSTAVMAVMAQRLVRVLCEECKQPVVPEPSQLRAAGLTPEQVGGSTFYRAVGCSECRGTGYRGRVGIFELFEMDTAMRDLTFKGGSTLELRSQALSSGGLVTLMKDGIRKALRGVTTLDEVLAATANEEVAVEA